MRERDGGYHQENPYPPQFAPLAERINIAFNKVGLRELPAAEIAQNLWRPPLELEEAIIEVEMSPSLAVGLKNNLLFLGHPPSEGQEQARITVARMYPKYLLHLQSFPPGWFSINQIMIENIYSYRNQSILADLVLLKTGQITWQSEEKLNLGPKYGLLIVSPAVSAIENPIVLNLMNLPANLGSIFGKDGKIQIIPSLRDTNLEAMKERFPKEYPPAPPRPKPKPPTTPVSLKASAESPPANVARKVLDSQAYWSQKRQREETLARRRKKRRKAGGKRN